MRSSIVILQNAFRWATMLLLDEREEMRLQDVAINITNHTCVEEDQLGLTLV